MNQFIAFIKLIRLPNLLIIAFTQYAIRFAVVGSFLGISGFELQMSELDFFLLSLSTFMIAAGGYIINDYFDTKVDRVNRPTKIIVGKYIKRRVCMGAHIIINAIAFLIALYVAYKMGNIKLALIQFLSIGALWYYSVYFKKQVIIGNLVVAILAALVPFVAGYYELVLQQVNALDTVNLTMFYVEQGTAFDDVMLLFQQILKNIMQWVIGYSLFAFLSTIIREIIKDIEDYEGDKKYGSNTLPVVYGKKMAKYVAQVVAVLMMIILGFLQYQQIQSNDTTSFMYFLFAIQIPLGYIVFQLSKAQEKKDYSKLSNYTKLVMLSGIVYSFLFTYSLFQA
jgi:4-hydroxybenzoate polyprenyltransferase